MSLSIKKALLILLLSVITLPAMAENTILVLGDSLSAAYGMQPEQSWINLLRKQLVANDYHYQIVNASVSGDTTSGGLTRLPVLLKKYQPMVTIVALGGNDGLRGLSLSVIKTNLSAIIAMAQAAKSKVLVLGMRLPPNYGPAYTQQFQQAFTQVAKDRGVRVVPLMLEGVDENIESFQADGIHPTAAVQPRIARNVWLALKPMI